MRIPERWSALMIAQLSVTIGGVLLIILHGPLPIYELVPFYCFILGTLGAILRHRQLMLKRSRDRYEETCKPFTRPHSFWRGVRNLGKAMCRCGNRTDVMNPRVVFFFNRGLGQDKVELRVMSGYGICEECYQAHRPEILAHNEVVKAMEEKRWKERFWVTSGRGSAIATSA